MALGNTDGVNVGRRRLRPKGVLLRGLYQGDGPCPLCCPAWEPASLCLLHHWGGGKRDPDAGPLGQAQG